MIFITISLLLVIYFILLTSATDRVTRMWRYITGASKPPGPPAKMARLSEKRERNGLYDKRHLYLRNIADSQIFWRTPKFSNLGVLLTPKRSGSKSTPVMTTALRLLYIDNILYNYINNTRKEKGLWETVCSHRPPFSTWFWGLKGGGGAHPLHPLDPLLFYVYYNFVFL